MRLALGLIVALVAAAAAPVGAFDDAELRSVVREVGLVPYRSFKPAPDFRYPDVATGRAVGLTELKGRVVLVNVWATWCPPCIKEMPALQGVHEELRDRGFAVIGVNVRDRKNPAAVAAWLGERKLTFVNLKAHDDGPDFPSSFYIPQTFLIDRGGRLIANKQGAWEWRDAGFKALVERLLEVKP